MPFYQTTSFINIALFILLVVVSSLIGHWLGKALRVVDYGWKFGVILFAMLASAVVVFRGWPPRLGVDLGGGSILVYKVDETKTEWRPEQDGVAADLDQQARQSRRAEGDLGEKPGHRHGGDRRCPA